jgi:hypothetical protein
MPQDHYAVIPRVSALDEASLDEPRPDATPLKLGQDRQRRQSHSRKGSGTGFNRDGAEANMSDDAASYHGHEGQCCLASHAESIYEVGFSGAIECPFMDLAHRRIIIWSLPTDAHHGSIVLQDVSDDGAGLLPPL